MSDPLSDLPSGLPPLDPAGLEAARARTLARGQRLQRRRQLTRIGGATVAAVVVLGGGLALANRDPADDRIHVVDDRTTTTDVPGGADDPLGVGTTTTAPPGLAVTTTTAPADPPPATDPADPSDPSDPTHPPSDGAQPACVTAVSTGADDDVPTNWQDYWLTEPAANDPLTLEICVSDAFPAPGDGFRLDVTADDPDAVLDSPGSRGFCHLRPCEGFADFDMTGAQLGGEPLAYVAPAAPVATPDEERGHATWYANWSYAEAGAYTITVTWWSPDYVQAATADGEILFVPTPYRSVATATITVTVG